MTVKFLDKWGFTSIVLTYVVWVIDIASINSPLIPFQKYILGPIDYTFLYVPTFINSVVFYYNVYSLIILQIVYSYLLGIFAHWLYVKVKANKNK